MKYIWFVFMLVPFVLNAQVELGKVDWLRDMESAVEESKKSDKDILVLFQEVPGCATCQRFGEQVLSDKNVVAVIEQHFIPLAIYNNKKGDDYDVLTFYNESTWNNPVMRIVNAEQENVHTRLAGQYSLAEVKDYLRFYFEEKEASIPVGL